MPFDDLPDYLSETIFGRNGRLEKLRRLLDKAGWKVLSDSSWSQLGQAQRLRNDTVHFGSEVSREAAEDTLNRVRTAIETLLEVMTDRTLP
jgi:hypothetical protein